MKILKTFFRISMLVVPNKLLICSSFAKHWIKITNFDANLKRLHFLHRMLLHFMRDFNSNLESKQLLWRWDEVALCCMHAWEVFGKCCQQAHAWKSCVISTWLWLKVFTVADKFRGPWVNSSSYLRIIKQQSCVRKEIGLWRRVKMIQGILSRLAKNPYQAIS